MAKSTDRHHGFVFFTQDYFGAIDVRLLPLNVRMVWVEAFFLMDLSPRRGVLLQPDGTPYTYQDLADTMRGGATAEFIESVFKTVIDKQIASKDRSSGQLANRKMLRDEMRRKSASISGRKGGGNPLLRANANNGKQKDLFETDKGPFKLARAIPDPDPDPDPELNSSLPLQVPVIPDGSSFEDSSTSANTKNASLNVDLAPRKNRVARKRDEAFDLFAAAHKEKTGAAYVKKSGDFPQLAILREANDVPALAMPERWQQAVENFFASPMASYSFADLCVRYPIFRNSALDGYRNPINHQNRRNGNGQQPRETRADRTRNAASSVLSRMRVSDGGGGERGAERGDNRDLSRKARTVK